MAKEPKEPKKTIRIDWYKVYIEEQIRDIVIALRNQGVNTTCSCGHEMWIECAGETADPTQTIKNIFIALVDLPGISEYKIETITEFKRHSKSPTDFRHRTYMVIKFPKVSGGKKP